MCGIYGFYQYKNAVPCKALEKIIESLALANIDRGKDSSGQAILDQSNKLHVIKKLGDAKHYYRHPKIREGLRNHFRCTPKAILGHTRAATTGEVNLMNAQPFIYGDIVGTHNGIIWNYHEKFIEHKLKPLTKCDSEIIFALLSTASDNKARAKLLSECSGYLAIAYLDQAKPDSIHLASVNNESLYAFNTPYGIFWSSIRKSLKKALRKYGIRGIEIDIPLGEIVTIGDDKSIQRENIPCEIWQVNSMPYNYPTVYRHQSDDINRICDNCYTLSHEPLNFKVIVGYGICPKCEHIYFDDYKDSKRLDRGV